MLYRHLRNVDELVFWGSGSCLLSLLGRTSSAFLFPTILLRLLIVGYIWFLIGKGEGHKLVAALVCGSILIGMVAGIWDGLGLWLSVNREGLIIAIQLSCCFALIVLGLWVYWGKEDFGSEDKK